MWDAILCIVFDCACNITGQTCLHQLDNKLAVVIFYVVNNISPLGNNNKTVWHQDNTHAVILDVLNVNIVGDAPNRK